MGKKDIKEILEDYKNEIIMHFDVIAENLKESISILSEQVGINTEKINFNTRQIVSKTETLEIIKMDLNFIKNELKQKI